MKAWVLLDWLLLLFACVGHFALHLVIYNRINATGLPRWMVKLIKNIFLATCLLIPIAVCWSESSWLWLAFQERLRPLPGLALATRLYGVLCIATLILFGPHWLRSRPSLNRDSIHVPTRTTRHRVQHAVDRPLPQTTKCRLFSKLPLNQIFDLAVEEKELPIPNLPPALDGFKIAHLSDIHLTGHVSPAFYNYAVQQALQWQPNLFALTGDVVDKADCIDWLPDCFGAAKATHGCYFVLGNHDLRVPDPKSVRKQLESLGWSDLGGRIHPLQLPAIQLELIGNESPWFPAPPSPAPPSPVTLPAEDPTFRLLLSHSPDQITWARKHHVHLMLAGHTHGGQGRLPWIGPVLSPSYYGSRYASGTFHLPHTTMHVSRGLSGVHLMRINCPPELALLTLRPA